MTAVMPAYLDVSPQRLGEGTPVRVRIVGDMAAVARDMADVMLEEIRRAERDGREATFIVPVGPVDQFPILAERINREHVDLRDVCFINMDEYLSDEDRCIDLDHPLSFRGYMNRLFYDRLNPELAPRVENRVFPDPFDCAAVQKIVDKRGGVDVCFGGIGINGHIAFNEPPEPDEEISNDAFAQLATRVLSLTRETRTINSVTVGGEIAVIPRRAVTVGMKECLAARKLRFYCNRPWQSAVVRRALHAPITAACPASFLRTHADAEIAVADYVAAKPEIRLR
ncbi:MAG: glucosamine-6-phosphate deaminase [Phycisphaerales bacterium]|jgi:glucosamine-6-phosphate deaminase|nr:glucosamine-6-phosphate deaminase [Phycisphaerales bacterium]